MAYLILMMSGYIDISPILLWVIYNFKMRLCPGRTHRCILYFFFEKVKRGKGIKKQISNF